MEESHVALENDGISRIKKWAGRKLSKTIANMLSMYVGVEHKIMELHSTLSNKFQQLFKFAILMQTMVWCVEPESIRNRL